MFKRILLATVLAASVSGIAAAAPITGSFSVVSLGGAYVGGNAMTATGLDFGSLFGGGGNGYGKNGSAIVGNGMGSFASLNGSFASISDISLGATANPYQSNPFVSFSTGTLAVNFSNASISRTATSITVQGSATFSDGIPGDTSTGVFSLATDSQTGASPSVNFTFTSNASVTPVPEPVSLSILGAGLVGVGIARRRVARKTA